MEEYYFGTLGRKQNVELSGKSSYYVSGIKLDGWPWPAGTALHRPVHSRRNGWHGVLKSCNGGGSGRCMDYSLPTFLFDDD
ncbi:hypothetical protein LguiA_015670 [Lonicera macranthoides]